MIDVADAPPRGVERMALIVPIFGFVEIMSVRHMLPMGAVSTKPAVTGRSRYTRSLFIFSGVCCQPNIKLVTRVCLLIFMSLL